jgi:hypothetical protein
MSAGEIWELKSQDGSKSYRIRTRVPFTVSVPTKNITVGFECLDTNVTQATLDDELPKWGEHLSKAVWDKLRAQSKVSAFSHHLQIQTSDDSDLQLKSRVTATSTYDMYEGSGQPMMMPQASAYSVQVERQD